jgi:thioredoxin
MKNHIIALMVISSLSLFACSGGSANGETGANTEGEPAAVQSQTSAEMATGDETTPSTQGAAAPDAKAGVVHLKTADFKEKVFNYEKNPETWVFEGERPCIVDFYADWCKPCKLIAPIMEELAVKYAGQIDIYKVNTDNERELASVFGIRSIPSVLFVPASGRPQMTQGALPKETFEEVIQNFLLNANPEGATAE